MDIHLLQVLQAEVAAWRTRFPQYEYRAQDECVALKLEQPKFGCHCELDPSMKPDSCVIDEGRPGDCVNATLLVGQGKGRNDCSEWRPVVFKST